MRKADNLPPSCAVVTKSGILNFLEASGPVEACNGTALSLHIHKSKWDDNIKMYLSFFLTYSMEQSPS